MVAAFDFTTRLEARVAQQLGSQRVGYLLGAGFAPTRNFGFTRRHRDVTPAHDSCAEWTLTQV